MDGKPMGESLSALEQALLEMNTNSFPTPDETDPRLLESLAILNQISNEVRRIFELPDVKDRLKNFDYLLLPSTPEELDRIIRADIETFSEVARLVGLRGK